MIDQNFYLQNFPNTSYGLVDAYVVFDEGKTDILVSVLTKPQTG